MADRCVACGMPMTKPEDHAAGDETKGYCLHCARPDGSMQSYDEKLASMSEFLVNTQGVDQTQARDSARRMMDDLPAWQDTPGES